MPCSHEERNSLRHPPNGGLNLVLGQFGKSVDFKNTWWGQLLGGNTFSGVLFGSGKDAALAAGASTPGTMNAGMGEVTTWGRRTTAIKGLNLAGDGGLPFALSKATTAGVKSFLSVADRVLGFGLDLTTKLEVDAALAAAEAAYCLYKTR